MYYVALLVIGGMESAVATIFRWRTWRDRGVVPAILFSVTACLLFTQAGTWAYQALSALRPGPPALVLVPAAAFLAGLLGVSPLLATLFFTFIHPDPRLAVWIAVPLLAGSAPQTLFRLLTLPPRPQS